MKVNNVSFFDCFTTSIIPFIKRYSMALAKRAFIAGGSITGTSLEKDIQTSFGRDIQTLERKRIQRGRVLTTRRR